MEGESQHGKTKNQTFHEYFVEDIVFFVIHDHIRLFARILVDQINLESFDSFQNRSSSAAFGIKTFTIVPF